MNDWLQIGLANALAATLLAVVAAAVSRVTRRPQVALVLWLFVLGKLLSPPLVGLPAVSLAAWLRADDAETTMPRPAEARASQPQSGVAADRDDVAEARVPPIEKASIEKAPMAAAWRATGPVSSREPLAEAPRVALAAPRLERLRTAVGWTWLAGSAAWFALAGVRAVRFNRLLRRAAGAPQSWQDEIAELARRMQLGRVPRVCVTHGRVPPLVWAVATRPTMLLPTALVRTLSREQRATLFAHELAHVARRDGCIRWLELAALGLYWWHPVAWWARRNVSLAQEQCCDMRVLATLPQAARAYAETLLATMDFLAAPSRRVPMGASAFSQAGPLHRRLTMILKQTHTRRTPWPLAALLTLTGVLVLPVSLHTLWAEPAAEHAEGPSTAGAAANAALERRLQRLEKMIETLAADKSRAQAPRAEAARSVAEKLLPAWASDLRRLEEIQNATTFALVAGHAHLEEQAARASELRERVQRASARVRTLFDQQRAGASDVEPLLAALRDRYAAQLVYAQAILWHTPALGDLMLTQANLSAAEEGRRDTAKLLTIVRLRGAHDALARVDRQHKSFEDSVRRFAAGVERWHSQHPSGNARASAPLPPDTHAPRPPAADRTQAWERWQQYVDSARADWRRAYAENLARGSWRESSGEAALRERYFGLKSSAAAFNPPLGKLR